ncbi:hypothetical protein D918_03472 [Trichuris suis]|nr:hypothetical protein D918_03472 [Trichuris suis]
MNRTLILRGGAQRERITALKTTLLPFSSSKGSGCKAYTKYLLELDESIVLLISKGYLRQRFEFGCC